MADWLADTDAASLRAQLAGGAASSPQRVDVASRLATRFVTPLAPVGIHATIRGRCPPLELLRREWTFHITGLTSFAHPKLGEPSQWDASWFCARWYALELCWDGPADDAAQGRAAERGGASGWRKKSKTETSPAAGRRSLSASAAAGAPAAMQAPHAGDQNPSFNPSDALDAIHQTKDPHYASCTQDDDAIAKRGVACPDN